MANFFAELRRRHIYRVGMSNTTAGVGAGETAAMLAFWWQSRGIALKDEA